MQRAKSRLLKRPSGAALDGTSSLAGSVSTQNHPEPSIAVVVTVTAACTGSAEATCAQARSIYDLYTYKQKLGFLVLVCWCCLIIPMTDTIYLPALERVMEDLRCSQAMAALSVAIYMLGAGVMALIWGPFADRFGRRWCYWFCSSAYIAATIGCVFAYNVQLLVTLRAFQGGSVTGFMAGGAGIIADVFPPKQRGLASATFSIPMLVGPVVGPLFGGAVAHAYSWRACFLVLAVFAGGALVLVFTLLRTETHQYYALQHIERLQRTSMLTCYIEAPQITANKPRFRPPWRPLILLCERKIFPYVAVKFMLFGSMFATLIILPNQLSKRESVLTGTRAGLAYVPVALACFLAAPAGGKSADIAAARLHPCKQGRMVPSLILAAIFQPIGLLTYGWSLQTRAHLAAVLIGHAFVGASVGCYTPALFSYLSVEKQQAAAAAASAVQAFNLVIAGLFIQVSVMAVDALGAGVFFTCLTGVCLMAIAGTGFYTYRLLHRGLLVQQWQEVEVTAAAGITTAAAALQ